MIRKTFALIAVLCTAALAASACSSGKVAVGSNGSNSNALKTKDGGPSGDGTTCSWAGIDSPVSHDAATGKPTTTPTQHDVGDNFPAPDGCNSCTCMPQGIACTQKYCGPPPSQDGGAAAVCEYEDHTWHVGDAIPSLDNCNTFTCTESGLAHTKMACVYTCPTQTEIDCQPIVAEQDLAVCFGEYRTWIVANCPNVNYSE